MDSVSRRKTLFFRHKLSEPIKCQSPEGPASVRVHVRGSSYCRLLLQLTCHDHTDQFSACVPTPELSKSTARSRGYPPSLTDWPLARGRCRLQRQRPAPRNQSLKSSSSRRKHPTRRIFSSFASVVPSSSCLVVRQSQSYKPVWEAGVGPSRKENGSDVASIC